MNSTSGAPSASPIHDADHAFNDWLRRVGVAVWPHMVRDAFRAGWEALQEERNQEEMKVQPCPICGEALLGRPEVFVRGKGYHVTCLNTGGLVPANSLRIALLGCCPARS